jgi:hypothetical protein
MPENWEIGRSKKSGLTLKELRTETLVELLREIVINYNWEAKIRARELVVKYDELMTQNKTRHAE